MRAGGGRRGGAAAGGGARGARAARAAAGAARARAASGTRSPRAGAGSARRALGRARRALAWRLAARRHPPVTAVFPGVRRRRGGLRRRHRIREDLGTFQRLRFGPRSAVLPIFRSAEKKRKRLGYFSLVYKNR